MSKNLKVIKPFFVMEPGDTFEFSQEDNQYVSTYNVEYNEGDDTDTTVASKYTSEYRISTDYANYLIEKGYLEEVVEKTATDKPFINVFDAISNLLEDYNEELNRIPYEMADDPECLKVEKRSVLTNMITLLDYLNSLKK